jgi:hypothetical protein
VETSAKRLNRLNVCSHTELQSISGYQADLLEKGMTGHKDEDEAEDEDEEDPEAEPNSYNTLQQPTDLKWEREQGRASNNHRYELGAGFSASH